MLWFPSKSMWSLDPFKQVHVKDVQKLWVSYDSILCLWLSLLEQRSTDHIWRCGRCDWKHCICFLLLSGTLFTDRQRERQGMFEVTKWNGGTAVLSKFTCFAELLADLIAIVSKETLNYSTCSSISLYQSVTFFFFCRRHARRSRKRSWEDPLQLILRDPSRPTCASEHGLYFLPTVNILSLYS